MTPPSGTWKKFTSSSVRYQVSGVGAFMKLHVPYVQGFDVLLLCRPGCQEIADEFRSQEIDGQALLLLKEDHLMSAMNIKLGPALKIFARINMLKDS